MLSPSIRFVGRQPILDERQRLFGYELLFRAGRENSFYGTSCMATRQTIDNVLLLGLDTVAPGGKAFINCTHEALVQRLVTSLPPHDTVLEVLETVDVDDEVVAACQELQELGYAIALDDYEPGTSSDRLLYLADYIKLDVRALGPQRLKKVRAALAAYPAKLLAEKVETCEEFRSAVSDGFSYFQGYFFCRPVISQHRELPQNQIVYLQLLSAVNCNPCDLVEIERLVSMDAALCFRVLRRVNSAGITVRNYITSVRQALLMIGVDEIRKMVILAGAANLGKHMKVAPELVLLAFQRARFGELLSISSGQFASEQFLVGLLSQFEAILQVPMKQIVDLVPLSHAAAAALLGEENAVGLAMRMMARYEECDWIACSELCRTVGLSLAEIESIYVSSLQWATAEVGKAGL